MFSRTMNAVPPGLRRWLLIGAMGAGTTAVAVLLAVGFVVHQALQEPLDLSSYLEREPSPRLTDRDGETLFAYLNEAGHWTFPVTLDEVSPHLVAATLAAEDQRFFQHPGVDPIAVLRAAAQNLWHRRIVSGASTLTMQAVKLKEASPRTYRGKAEQAVTALRLEQAMAKEDILELYLNHAPYGMNLLGVEAAARRYFGQPARELSIAQAALLAGLPKAPGDLNPFEAPGRAMARRNYVLRRMSANGHISEAQYRRALQEPLGVQWHEFPRLAPHTAMWFRKQAAGAGVVQLTLDAGLQRDAEERLRRHVDRFEGRVGNGALVALDAATGDMLARAGSRGFFDTPGGGEVDVTRAPRSPGSALKPFTYGLAMKRDQLYPTEALLDETLDFGVYRPANFDGRFRGVVTATDALRHSLNVPAVAVLNRVGYESVYQLFKELDLTTLTGHAAHYGLGLTLGSAEVRLDELTGAYGMLANNGVYVKPGMLKDRERAAGREVFPPGVAASVRGMLRQPLPRDHLPAHLVRVRQTPRMAWKTGTSSGLRDAWAFAYDERYVVGVWMGHNDGSPSGALVGANAALPLAAEMFQVVTANEPKAETPPREELLRTVSVCARSGLPATAWCPRTVAAEIPREQYVLRRCGVHYPTRSAETQEAAGAGERWPGAARNWDLARIAEARQDRSEPRRRSLEIIAPAHQGQYVLTGEEQGDQLRLRSSLDGETEVHWYLNGRYLGKTADGNEVMLELDPGDHEVTCMTPSGATRTAEFTVERPERKRYF
ncbi:MAG: penicillin-binding protein 1C [Candidatus Hydrogenedentota bacterium]